MPREVLTLQFGSFANYVGAHYWNFQDELLGLQAQQDGRGPAAQIDSDVLFRQGETASGEGAFTPRLVLWDLSGALGGVSAGGSLYRDSSCSRGAVVSTWAGQQEVHRARPVSKSAFTAELEAEAEAEDWEEQCGADAAGAGPSPLEVAARQLDSAPSVSGSSGGSGGVRYWTDFLKAHLHPRSVQQLAGAWHGLTPFGGWGDGAEHWRSEEQREEMMERIRFFAEESDSLQGFQVLADDLSGFGHLAAHVLQEVRDDYGSSLPVMLYTLRPQSPLYAQPAAAAAAEGAPAQARRQRLNEGLSLALLAQQCSTYTVVAPPPAAAALPALRWQPGNVYHASGLCAAALDTATLPYRLAARDGPAAAIGRCDMWGLTHLLTSQYHSPLAALSLALPCPGLPTDAQRLAQQADARLQHDAGSGGGSASAAAASAAAAAQQGSSGGGGGGPFTSRWLASLTPGIPAAGDTMRFAEAVVLRGPRSTAAAPMQLDAAAAALDAALADERLRCVRQRTLAAQPLAVPLPFPHMFALGLSKEGDLLPGAQLGASSSGGSQDIASCAALTRLAATKAFAPAVAAAARQFRTVAGTAQGQATLEAWGLGREERAEAEEALQRLAHAYDDEEA